MLSKLIKLLQVVFVRVIHLGATSFLTFVSGTRELSSWKTNATRNHR